jgi:hypothetical protein
MTHQNENEPTTWLTAGQVYLVLVRALKRQIGLTDDQAHQMACNRFPMSVAGVQSELETRGLAVSTTDIEDFVSRVTGRLHDPLELRFGPVELEACLQWLVAERRVKHSRMQESVRDLQRDESFIEAGKVIESKMQQAFEESKDVV